MSKSILKGLLRKAIGVGFGDDIVAPKGLSTGGDAYPSVVLPAWNSETFTDDFVGVYLADTGSGGSYYNLHGTDSGGDNSAALLSGGPSAVRLVAPQNFPVSNGGGAPDMQGLVGGRNWTSNQGRLRFVARLRNADTGSTANGVSIFAGFTDDTGTTEVAFYVDTGENTSNLLGEIAAKATDAVGFLFDTAIDTGSGLGVGDARWCGVAVNNGTVKEPVIASRGLVPNVWDTVELVLDNDRVHFWLYDLNGAGRRIGAIDAPVTKGIKLAPVLSITGHNVAAANVNKLDVDFLHVSANRDTGT